MGDPRVPLFEMRTEGVAEAIRRAVERRMGAFREATVDVVAGGSRGGAMNAMIAKVQRAHGRNPFYVDPDTRSVLKTMVKAGLAREGGLTSADFTAMGELILRAVRTHMEAQRGPGGAAFRPLSDAYAAAKRKKFGDKPILEASEQLVDTLSVRVRVN